LIRSPALAIVIFLLGPASHAQKPAPAGQKNGCSRPGPGSVVHEPRDLSSRNGVLKVDLAYRNFTAANGQREYCYRAPDGSEAPTLRVNPGDIVILHLRNELNSASSGGSANTTSTGSSSMPAMDSMSMEIASPCANSRMTALSTNLHFHGLTVPPVCHQDDVLRTVIQPGDAPFEYRFRIPLDEPPGLYWYHPHVHGFTKDQVLGGASGALIVEGIERANKALAGLPERVFVVRDQNLTNPTAKPLAEPTMSVPPVVLDRDGDALNTGTGTGVPAKDLSLNFVPIPFPDYPPAVIEIRPLERQLWRVLNASAITYLNLEVLFNKVPQQLGTVAIDGVPTNENGDASDSVIWQNHLAIPPGGRIEFILNGPPAGTDASLVTLSVNTGRDGENDPVRPLAKLVAKEDAPEPSERLPQYSAPLPPRLAWLGNVTPTRTRKLYFSEKVLDPNDPNSPTTYFITVDGQTPKAFDPSSSVPDIITHQGDVEDWIIENRTQEVHAFHIHQVHFILLSWFGLPVHEPFLRDTVNVPFWDGKSSTYPVVKLRLDFRDPNTVGTFVYHCHILEHEDGGMMGLIRVEARVRKDE
jgi:FtsP/CotA-like multicopper oxidase with cupredoxin domain